MHQLQCIFLHIFSGTFEMCIVLTCWSFLSMFSCVYRKSICAQVFPQNTSCKNGHRWHWYCNIHVPILSNHLFFSWQLQYHLILCFVEVPKRSKTHPRFGTPINHINRGKNKVWHVFDILVHLRLAFIWLQKILFVYLIRIWTRTLLRWIHTAATTPGAGGPCRLAEWIHNHIKSNHDGRVHHTQFKVSNPPSRKQRPVAKPLNRVLCTAESSGKTEGLQASEFIAKLCAQGADIACCTEAS